MKSRKGLAERISWRSKRTLVTTQRLRNSMRYGRRVEGSQRYSRHYYGLLCIAKPSAGPDADRLDSSREKLCYLGNVDQRVSGVCAR